LTLAQPVSDVVHDIEQYSPRSGRVIGEDGELYNIVDLLAGGVGTTDHAALSNLDFASSGHTDFASEAALNSEISNREAAIAAKQGQIETINGELQDTNAVLLKTNEALWGHEDPVTKEWVAGTLQNLQDAVDALENPPVEVNTFVFTNATFSGEQRAIAVEIGNNVTMVSFTGFALQNATGTSGQDFVIVSPTDFPLLERFIGQVDQFGVGYNANTGNFSYVPIRITSTNGLEIVTAPNVAVGTRFTWQFVLFLVEPDAQPENAITSE